MKTVQEKITVMQAYVDGKTIQIYQPTSSSWEDWRGTSDLRAPNFDWGRCNYRIKEDMEQKAQDTFCDTMGYESPGITSRERVAMRALIDAVKRGDIT
jgi:hypothetical protein